MQLRAITAAVAALIASYRGAGEGGNSPLYNLDSGSTGGSLQPSAPPGASAFAASAGTHQVFGETQGASAAPEAPALL